MKKVLMIILTVSSFAFISFDSVFDKDVLLTGTIITPKWYEPNGRLEFSLLHENLKIQELRLKGSVLIFSQDTIVPLSKMKKDSLTPISLSKTLDKMVRINIDPNFSNYGGLIYIDITLHNGNIDNHTLLVLKEKVNKKDQFRIYRKQKGNFKLISAATIKLNNNREIETYSLE